MPNNLNGNEKTAIQTSDETPNQSPIALESTQDWSYATKELLDTLPQAWTRGLLYFLVIFISIVLPWAIFSKIDETGTARGRIEPAEETIKLDATVAGTVAEVRVKEGEKVKKNQVLLQLESDLVQSDLKQAQDKLEGQLNRRNQLNLLKTQLIVSLSTQQQQNKAAELEKQSQVDQAQESLMTLKNTYSLLKAEKQAQVHQAETTLKNNQDTFKISDIRFGNAKREIQRYRQAAEEGVVSASQVAEREDNAQERQRLYEQSQSDIEQAKQRLDEQKSSYEKAIGQAKSDIDQGYLRFNQQQKGLLSLVHTNELAILKIQEQLKNNDTEITTLTSEIAQIQSQINSLKFQLSQRSLEAPVSGVIFQFPIQKAGAVVQVGTRIAEIAAQNSPLMIRAQMPTTDSGSLRLGLPVKVKLDAYPFQDYGIVEGKLLKISPTTSLVETPNGKIEMYRLEISLNQTCMKTANQCIAFRPGDTATAEVIVRQRRIIDFVLDPFKKLQKGGLKL